MKYTRNPIKKLFWLLTFFVLISSFYHIYYAKKIIPGVRVAGINIGGMTYSKAKNILEQLDKKTTKELSLKFEEKVFLISGNTVGLTYDWDATVSRAFEVGRTGNLIRDSKEKLAGFVKPLYIKAFYDIEDQTLSNEFSKVRGEVDVDGTNSYFVINNGKLELIDHKDGRNVDYQAMYDIVIASFDNMDFSTITLPVETKRATLLKIHLEPFTQRVENVVFNTFEIKYNGRVWKLNPSQILEFIAFNVDKDDKIELTVDKAKLGAYVFLLKQEVNELPRGEVTRTEGDRVAEFKFIRNGRKLDEKSFTEDFKKSLLDVRFPIELKVNEVQSEAKSSDYGIFSLLGLGSSKFAGSSSERIYNLSLAAERTNGVLVAPGAIYSFNNAIGDISSETGYNTAYIISNGRTVLGEGGGVCQTSTTLFRAILNSGLPITMRYPHAYRVYYYELDSPVGFDASIFQPSLDLQFRNDTPGYVLIQSYVDKTAQTLEFKLYGTPDGRKIEVSQPVVSNLIAPPETLYQDDFSLPLGVVKQIDFAAWGADVFFTRKVTKNDKVMYEDTFSSKYQPWRAIYLVGKKK